MKTTAKACAIIISALFVSAFESAFADQPLAAPIEAKQITLVIHSNNYESLLRWAQIFSGCHSLPELKDKLTEYSRAGLNRGSIDAMVRHSNGEPYGWSVNVALRFRQATTAKADAPVVKAIMPTFLVPMTQAALVRARKLQKDLHPAIAINSNPVIRVELSVAELRIGLPHNTGYGSNFLAFLFYFKHSNAIGLAAELTNQNPTAKAIGTAVYLHQSVHRKADGSSEVMPEHEGYQFDDAWDPVFSTAEEYRWGKGG